MSLYSSCQVIKDIPLTSSNQCQNLMEGLSWVKTSTVYLQTKARSVDYVCGLDVRLWYVHVFSIRHSCIDQNESNTPWTDKHQRLARSTKGAVSWSQPDVDWQEHVSAVNRRCNCNPFKLCHKHWTVPCSDNNLRTLWVSEIKWLSYCILKPYRVSQMSFV